MTVIKSSLRDTGKAVVISSISVLTGLLLGGDRVAQSSGPQAQATSKVLVTNRTDQAVPVSVRGTVPVDVQGTVPITGLVGVSGPVAVKNEAGDALLVQSIDETREQYWQSGGSLTASGGANNHSFFVPGGKRLYMRQLTYVATFDAGQKLGTCGFYIPELELGMPLAPQFQADAQRSVNRGTNQLDLAVDGPATIQFSVANQSGLGSCNLSVTLTGYLTPIP